MSQSQDSNISEFFEESIRRMVLRCPVKKIGRKLARKMSELPDEFLEASLGQFGKKIKSFLNSVDIDHPDMPNCYDGFFRDDGEFASFFSELVAHARLSAKTSNSMMRGYIGESAEKHIMDKHKAAIHMDVPENNRCNVRLVTDKSLRGNIRSKKRMQVIDLDSVYKKGIGFYMSHPDNFLSHMRFDLSLESEISKLEVKSKRYVEMGCSAMADEINSSLECYREYTKQTYFGFNRITMSAASIILAKSLGYEVKVELCPLSGAETYAVRVGSGYFGDYCFDPSNAESRSERHYPYEPKIYPIDDFADMMTDNTRRVIGLLEKFHDAGKKPIFDFFGVIVPSIRFPSVPHEGSYSFLNKDGFRSTHYDLGNCVFNFNRSLVKNNFFKPIIVAEKDHKCYFITYWT
jgi:hypothetical protein